MYKELCNKAIAEKKNPIHYILNEMKKDCKYLLETGSHMGNTINTALELGFEKIISCEFNRSRYNHCTVRFYDKPVHLFCGYSTKCMPKMIKLLDKKALIWLDAHSEGGGVPTVEELQILKNCPIKNHTILIDDIPEYFNTKESLEELKQAILDINKDYIFVEIETNHGSSLDVLGAYVP